jgi:hypothetical protein
MTAEEALVSCAGVAFLSEKVSIETRRLRHHHGDPKP